MALIVLKVVRSLGRWAVIHNGVALASFATRVEAERSALAVAKHHPAQDSAELDLTFDDGRPSEIRIF
jgi:hypothetical protein